MKKLSLLLIALMLVVLAACGKTEDKSSTSNEEKASEESYTVTHAMGETTIKGQPKRIVVLTNEGVEAVLAMGITPVGAVEAFTGDTWYKHTAEQLKDTKAVGNE